MTDTINQDQDDGVDRRGFLHCMAWAGTGMAWIAGAGILKSAPLPRFVRRSHAFAIVDQTLA
jgi:Icc protein